jgi:hypothetical protein
MGVDGFTMSLGRLTGSDLMPEIVDMLPRQGKMIDATY